MSVFEKIKQFLYVMMSEKREVNIMQYTASCHSPLGAITMAGDEIGLIGLWFEGQKYYGKNLSECHQEGELLVFDDTRKWLDIYFAGRNPGAIPRLHMMGTKFQLQVWAILNEIPYGETVTYGSIARTLEQRYGYRSMSAQAVGGAVGRNPVSILVPCHRVVGSGGNLTGYAGGIEKKQALLELERRRAAEYGN